MNDSELVVITMAYLAILLLIIILHFVQLYQLLKIFLIELNAVRTEKDAVVNQLNKQTQLGTKREEAE